IALQADTVTQPPARSPNALLTAGPAALGGASLIVGIMSLVAVSKLKKRRRTLRGVVVAQYDVPRELPPLVAAPLVEKAASPIGAQILHLAVSGCLRLEEADETSRSARPILRV